MSSETFYKDICQTIFEASGEGILVVKNDGSILMANRACEQMFGYDSGMLQNKNIDILIPDQLRKDYKNYINNFVKSTRKRAINKEIDLEVVKKDGTEISLDISLSSSLFEGEKVTIAFLRDMSARKNHFKKIQQTNEALIESNRKFDALINNLEDIVYRCKNDQDWTMEYISEGCENITGYSPKSFVNGSVHFRHIILAEDQEKVWSDTQKGIDNKKPFSLSYRIKNKKGAIKFMKEIGQGVFDDNGHLEAVEGFIRDVTAEKKKEFILKANKAKLKALLESNPDVLFIQNHEGVYLDWYANSPEKLFMPPEKFIGVNMKDVLAPHVYKKIKASHQKVIASGSMQIAEYSIEGKKEIEHYEARVVLMNNKKLLTIARNITDVKAQEALLKIRNDALASADNSILIADAKQPNTPIIYCNVAFLELTGYTENEVYGRDYNFLRDDERNQKEIDLMNKAIANGESCKVILRNYKKDGTLFWNEVAITPVRNENEELTHFISVQNDVSKRIKEEHLKNHIRQILELITQDKSLKTIGNKIIETAEEHFKGGIASILLLDKKTRKLHKLSAPNLPNAISQVIEGVVTGPEEGSSGTAAFLKKEIIITDIEHNIRCEKYKEIALKNEFKSCWAFPILSSTKQVLGTFSIYSSNKRGPLDSEQEIIRDMTYLASVAIEKHNNIKTLKESKKQLEYDAQKLEEKVKERTQEVMVTVQKLVEINLNLEDQILITEEAEKNALESKALASAVAKNFPKGFIAVMNKDLQLVLAEGEALNDLGLTQILIEGITLDDVLVFAEARKTIIQEDISKTLAGAHLSFEIQYKNRYFSVNTAPLFDENNQITNALMVYNDISEQKEIEFNIQNALKKERELNGMKSRFVSMASHEFRTPLSAILTSAILIGKQNEAGKEKKREKYVLQIEKNVNHLVTILNDFLSLSKLEEGKIEAVKEHFNLVRFSKIVVDENKISLKKGQKISFNTTIKELFVNLDTKLLRHIITNLLSNASKYSDEHSSIDFNISQKENKVLIQITDQGIGIPQDEQLQLFNRFYRAKNAVNIEGTGLGLNIAKHYAELMGGTIGFISKLNVGTTFWVELPVETI